ncbi:GIY-YIG nuclease family protein [Methanococcus maripaludis]|uniref:DUF4357 domain-containing protein n=1 Tax=Methanococcus maripaludis TaxID=39152 RepID=A0A7J9PNV7_METMI|nr:GIY-YIG nuclease family protein [Methanococcus maripaludis]MBA2864396.1 hypothetical protein [Methanococcus maripaludis]
MIELVNGSREVSVTLVAGSTDGIIKYDFIDSVLESYLIPRDCYNDFRNLKNLKSRHSGIYVLIGDNDEFGNYEVYIGYSEDIVSRLTNHNSNELFDWKRAACIISQKPIRNEYFACIERISINRAKNTADCILVNSNENKTPLQNVNGSNTLKKLMNDVSEYLALMGYPILGEVDKESENFIYLSQNGEILARGKFLNDNVIVLEGSLVKAKESDSMTKNNKNIKQNLVKNEILVPCGEFYIFTEDYVFSSPSSAACVAFGGNVSGRQCWKTKDGKTLKELFASG